MIDLTPDPLADRLAAAVRRALAGSGPGPDAFARLREIDAPGYEAPAAAGGLDLGLAGGVVVARELGRGAHPEVYGGNALLLDALRAGGGSPELPPGLVSGRVQALVGGLDVVTPGRSGPGPVGERGSDGCWVLAGAVIVDDVGGSDAGCGIPFLGCGEVRLAWLPAGRWRGAATRCGDRSLAVPLDGLRVPPPDVVGSLCSGPDRTGPVDVPADPAGVLARARLRQAGYLLGLAEGAYAKAVRRAVNRRQFDRALLDHQGVAFPLARAHVSLATVQASLWHAVWRSDAGMPVQRHAVEVLALAVESAESVVRVAMQVHGAYGMTSGSAMPAYHRELRAAAARLGAPGALWLEAGARRLAAAPAGAGDGGGPIAAASGASAR